MSLVIEFTKSRINASQAWTKALPTELFDSKNLESLSPIKKYTPWDDGSEQP